MRYVTENLLLSLHHTGGQEVVKVKEGAVLVVHVVLEPRLVAILRKLPHNYILQAMVSSPRQDRYSPCR